MRKLFFFCVLISGISLIFSLSCIMGSNFHGPRSCHGPGPHLATTGVFNSLFKSKTWNKFTNLTIGHANGVLSVGLHADETDSPQGQPKNGTANSHPGNSSSLIDEEIYEEFFEDEPEDESLQLIQLSEMDTALSNAQVMMAHTHEEILAQGWKLVHQCEAFSLYKRRQKRPQGDGPVEYVMKGQFPDVSPRTFFLAQIDCSLRKLWDKSMKEMSNGEISLEEHYDTDKDCTGKVSTSQDKLYFRAKWPWPMKDRDYALARRCKIYHNDSTIVFISKSHDNVTFPSKDGALRVDNYWCHSAFKSLPQPSISSSSTPAPASLSPPPSPSPELPSFPSVSTPTSPPAAAGAAGGMEAEAAAAADSGGNGAINPEALVDVDTVACPQATQHYQNMRLMDHFTQLHKENTRYLRSFRIHPHYRRYQSQYLQKVRVKQGMLLRQLSRLKGVLGDAGDVGMDGGGKDGGGGVLVGVEAVLDEVLLPSSDAVAIEQQDEEVTPPSAQSLLPPRIRIRKPPRNNVCKPGMQFVTIFCDDQKVPLHPTIVDMIASHAEKVVPTSIQKLYEIARLVEEKKIGIDTNCKCEEG